jgi:hypothetical protein
MASTLEEFRFDGTGFVLDNSNDADNHNDMLEQQLALPWLYEASCYTRKAFLERRGFAMQRR